MVNSPEVTEMLVLASSRKIGGRCLAGLDLATQTLIRPVANDDGELHIDDCQIDGAWPEPLDVVRFQSLGHDGRLYQPENKVLAETAWEGLEPFDHAEVAEMLEPLLHETGPLLGPYGRVVPEAAAADGWPESLAVVEPNWLTFEKANNPWGVKPKLWAHFGIGDDEYSYNLTDFEVRNKLISCDYGAYHLTDLGFPAPDRTILTVSLGEPYYEKHFKLVPAVVRLYT